MPLNFEEEVVSESMRSVPAMINAHLLILAIFQLLPFKAVMFDIVNCLEVNNRKNNHKDVDY